MMASSGAQVTEIFFWLLTALTWHVLDLKDALGAGLSRPQPPCGPCVGPVYRLRIRTLTNAGPDRVALAPGNSLLNFARRSI